MYRVYQKHLLFNGDIHKEATLPAVTEKFKNSSALFYRRVLEWNVDYSPYYYIIQDSAIREENLKPKDRNALRKALKSLQYVTVELDELVEQGLELYKALPQDGDINPDSDSFKNYLSSRGTNQDFWLVKNQNGSCVAFAACTLFNESVDLSILRVSRKDKSNAVYGLMYELSRFYLRSQGKKYINDGFKSYLHGAGFQDFLCKKLGYRKCYVNIELYSKIPIKMLELFLILFSFNSKLKSLKAYLKDNRVAQK